MEKLANGVLKSDALRPGQPCRIGQPPPTEGGAGPSSGPTARVVQQTDTCAIVEVVCSCGNSIRVQCDYSDPVT